MHRPLISLNGVVMDKMCQIGHPTADGSRWLPYHDTALSKQISEELKWRALSTNADISFIGFHPRFPDLMIVIAGPLLYTYNALSGDCISIIEIVPKQDQQTQTTLDKFTIRSACICSELQLKSQVGQQSSYEIPTPVLSVLVVTEEAPRYIIVIEIPTNCKRVEISVKKVLCPCELVEIVSESYPFSPTTSAGTSSDPSRQQGALKSGTSFIYLVEPRAVTVCQLNSISGIRSATPARIAFPNLISVATTPKHGTIVVASGTRVYFIHIDEKTVAESVQTAGPRSTTSASKHIFDPTIIKVLSFDEAREYKGIQRISISNDGTKLLLAFKTHMAVYSIDQGFRPRSNAAPSGSSTFLMARVGAQEAKLIARLHFPEIPHLLDVFTRANELKAKHSTIPYILLDFDLSTYKQIADSFEKQPDGCLHFSHIFTFACNQSIEWSPDDNVVVLASLNGVGDSIYWDLSNALGSSLDNQETCDIDGTIWSPGSVAKCSQMVRKCFKFVPGTAMIVTASNGSLLTYVPERSESLGTAVPDGSTI